MPHTLANGHGLSYTTYKYTDLKADSHSVTFKLTNTGTMAGAEIAQVYAMLPASSGEPFKRLAGWQRVSLAAGEARIVTISLNPLTLSVFQPEANAWKLLPGSYNLAVGGASDATSLETRISLP